MRRTARGRGKARGEAREQQKQLDAAWDRLQHNEPETVIASLEQAFADNGAPATPVDCHDGLATVTMLYGHPDVIPERTPAVTPTGKTMLRKRTKTERNALYLDSLASNVLATLKEGFAVCPALGAISILVVRRDPLPTGGEQLVAIYAATFSRQSIADVDWPRIDLAMAIDQPGDR